jgi:hypothetical protein
MSRTYRPSPRWRPARTPAGVRFSGTIGTHGPLWTGMGGSAGTPCWHGRPADVGDRPIGLVAGLSGLYRVVQCSSARVYPFGWISGDRCTAAGGDARPA